MIKSWLITIAVLLAFVAAYHLNLFSLLASRGIRITALILVLMAFYWHLKYWATLLEKRTTMTIHGTKIWGILFLALSLTVGLPNLSFAGYADDLTPEQFENSPKTRKIWAISLNLPKRKRR